MSFLTKEDPFAAVVVAVLAQFIAHWPTRRDVALFVAAAVVPPLVALLLLWLAMPLGDAARGVAGSWPWVFDRRVVALPFYRKIAGVDDVAGNLWAVLQWTLGYAAVFVPAGIIASVVR